VNAAWWHITVLAMNVTSMLKMFFLPEILRDCRVKKLRNVFFTLAGKWFFDALSGTCGSGNLPAT
jgi:hypothetical protein